MPNLVFPSCIIHLFALKFFFFYYYCIVPFLPPFLWASTLYFTQDMGLAAEVMKIIKSVWRGFTLARNWNVFRKRGNIASEQRRKETFFSPTRFEECRYFRSNHLLYSIMRRKKTILSSFVLPPRTRTLCRLSSHLAVLPFIIFIDLVSAFK